jgi:DNA-binding MarR family transcriptional regulator
MNHHGHGIGSPFWIWLVIGGILLVVAIVALLSYFRGRQADGLSRAERRELGPVQAEILAMIRQNGGPMLQTELTDTLLYDTEDIAGMLKDLESKGLIRREWKSENETYEITPVS